MNFVKTIRATEAILGITVPGVKLAQEIKTSNFTEAVAQATSTNNSTDIFNAEVTAALQEAAPILIQMAIELAIPTVFALPVSSQREPLMAK